MDIALQLWRESILGVESQAVPTALFQVGMGSGRNVVLLVFGRALAILLCSAKGVSPRRCSSSGPALAKVVTSLPCSTPVKVFNQTSFKRFIGREESRRMAPSARVNKGSFKLNRYGAYIGLLLFQGKDFQGGNWLDFNPQV